MNSYYCQGQNTLRQRWLKMRSATRRDSGFTRYECVNHLDRHGFAQGFVSFRTLCGLCNPVSKHQIQPEFEECMGRLTRDGTAERVSRDQILGRERKDRELFAFSLFS